jgi:hypothetical protein
MLDFRISLIDRIRGLSFGFGFKNVGFSQGMWIKVLLQTLDFGFSLDFNSFFGLGLSGSGFGSLSIILTIQTYNSTAGGARA